MAVTRLTRQGNVAILTMVNGENRHNPVFAKFLQISVLGLPPRGLNLDLSIGRTFLCLFPDNN